MLWTFWHAEIKTIKLNKAAMNETFSMDCYVRNFLGMTRMDWTNGI